MTHQFQYDFSHKERGFAVVIVNKNFPADSGLKTRRGWKRDMERMKTLFKSLQFRVKCYKNLKGAAMTQKVKKACTDGKNTDSDCFACVISTHGSEEPEKKMNQRPGNNVYQHCVYGSDGTPVYLNGILENVNEENSPYLLGKPKLFFVQACRSRHDESKAKYDYGVVIEKKKAKVTTNDKDKLHADSADQIETGKAGGDFETEHVKDSMSDSQTSDWDRISEDEWNSDDSDSDSDTESSDQEDPRVSPDTHEPPPVPVDVVPITCPTDCLVMYPVTSGKIAFTNPRKGSYLLSYMYSKMNSLLEKRDLLQYLTEIVKEMAKYDYNPEYKPEYLTVDEFYNCPFKMSACIVHRLTCDVLFTPKKEKHVLAKIKNFIDDKVSCVA